MKSIPDHKTKTEYFQRLPHFQHIGAIFFVSFRLFGSIPKSKLQHLKNQYEKNLFDLSKLPNSQKKSLKIISLKNNYFADFDNLLDIIGDGPTYLKNDPIANMVAEQIHRFDGEFYDLLSFTIMHNHVHLLIDTSVQLSKEDVIFELFERYVALDQIMKRIKGPTAIYANRMLERSGQFWERESYDVYIRNDKMLKNVISYILENPVKVGLVNNWEEYKWNYLKY